MARTHTEYRQALEAKFGECPFCCSEDLETDDLDGEKDLTVRVTCESCKGTWREHYRYSTATDFQPKDAT